MVEDGSNGDLEDANPLSIDTGRNGKEPRKKCLQKQKTRYYYIKDIIVSID